eukprot:gene10210-11894_t
MSIQAGTKVPLTSTLWKCAPPAADGSCPIAQKITSAQLFENKKVVVFAVPGAYTPTCSAKHLPGFITKAAEIKAKGVDTIICMATNDAFVMSAWGKDSGAADAVQLIADGNSEFTKAVGLEFDGSAFGMGASRSKRYAMIVDNAEVKYIGVEGPGQFELSTAENILAQL